MRLFLLVSLVAGSAFAQPMPAPANPCPQGVARAELTGGNVRAALYTNGKLFYDSPTAVGQYIVPAESGVTALYEAGFWLAGRVAGEVRAASPAFGEYHYRPGLIGTDRVAPSPAECAAADRIWTVARTDVETYEQTGKATTDLAEWPVALGAPVRDGDGIPDNFSLAAGDRPLLRGDVTAFWAMTDAAVDRHPADGLPLGADVTVEAFSFLSGPEALTTGTFYRYAVTNRSAVAIDSLHAGLWLEYDLGGCYDDAIGTDTTAAMLYVYNADDFDEDRCGYGSYGAAPPAVGTVVLDSPVGADGRPLGLTASHFFVNSAPQPLSHPAAPYEVFQRMRGRFNDGTPMREYRNGYYTPESAPVTTFAFPGDPVTDQLWSERNVDGTGTDGGPSDRRSLLASGSFTLASDSTAAFVFGIVYGRGTSHLHSVTVLRQHAAEAQAAYHAGLMSTAGEAPVPGVPALRLRPPAPNPFRGSTVLTLDGQPATVVVVDVLGREVERHAVPPGTTRVRLGAGLAAGVYTVEVMGVGVSVPLTIVKAE